MSGRCVCGHGQFLHRDGVCFAILNPCGCTSFETPPQAERPSSFPKSETYNGRYSGRKWAV